MVKSWIELSEAERRVTWDRFDAKFRFRPSTTDWPGIREPAESVTYGIGHVYGEPDRYDRLTMDLSEKLIAALRRCVPEDGFVYALDWQHPCYRFAPHAPFDFSDEGEWLVPVLPNGDYYVFLEPDLAFGVVGHPWEQTMCVFGAELIEAIAIDPPRLYDRPGQSGRHGHVARPWVTIHATRRRIEVSSTSPTGVLAVLTLAVVPCLAQRPVVTNGDHLSVEILSVDAGKKSSRLPKKEGDGERDRPGAVRVVGRKVAWRIGSRKLEDRGAFVAGLERAFADGANWREDPDQPGVRAVLPLVLKPSDDLYWVDVVEAIDDTLEAGFNDVNCADTGEIAIIFIAKSVRDPVRGGGAHVVPEAKYGVPDEDPPGFWRPTVHVHQDGSVAIGGKTVVDGKQRDGDAEALKKALNALAVTAAEKHGSRKAGPEKTEFLNARLLVHADKWARWGDVRRVVQLATATSPGFWKFEYAVGEYDFEARLLAGERF